MQRIVAEHFGPDAEVRVFGSRARVDLRGGDLDLRGGDLDQRVRVPGVTPAFGVEVRVANVLEKATDDRHVDLILPGTEDWPRRHGRGGLGDRRAAVSPLDLPRAVALAARLAESLRRSRERLAAAFPVGGAAVAAFDEAKRAEADAFLKRFENLIDHLQDQVFRLVVVAEAAREFSGLSRRDTADYMEKPGVVADSDAFFDALRARNRLSHVYPAEPARQADQLNAAWRAADVVVAAATADAWAAKRGLGPPPAPP